MKNYKARREFVSPVFGNVFVGNKLLLSEGQAKNFIEMGLIDDKPIDDLPADETPVNANAELDLNGLPWDERIHSSNQKKTQDGLWQRRRNVSDEEFDAVVAEIKTGVEPDNNTQTEETTG